jgi:NAD+ synthase (glutamine-hydrolysing)
VKIALAQIDTTVGDFAGNAQKIVNYAQLARERGADLAIFPELALCGYPPRDLVEKAAFIERSEIELLRLADALPPIPTLVGYVRHSHADRGKPAANAAALIEGGKKVADYAKILLPFYDVFDESRYFEPGLAVCVHDFHGLRVGITICEDVWNDKNFWDNRLYVRDPVEECVQAGADLLLNIASSPYSTEKLQLRHDMLKAIAEKRRIPVAYVNHVGGNDQLVFDGSSLAFNNRGELGARAQSFAEDLVVFDTSDGASEIRPAPQSEVEEIYRALCLGVRDYVRKCGFVKVLVGLSGGIDSSLVATIAADALGPENVLGVGMPGPYSSTGSIRDRRYGGEHSGPHPRQYPDGALQQVRFIVADHGEQIRTRSRLLHALWRHGGGAGRDRGRPQDHRVRSGALCESRPGAHSAGLPG